MIRCTQGTRAAGIVVLLALMATAPVRADEGPLAFDGEFTLSHDSNITRAERKRDIISDQSALANVGVVLLTEPTATTALDLRAFLEGEAWKETSPLDRSTVGGQAILRWAPLQGFRAPLFQLTLTGQVDDYGVRQRDSAVYTEQLFVRQSANDRIHVSYGVEATQRRSDGTVFDTLQERAFLSADFALDRNLSAYTNYSFITGDTFSSAQISFCNDVPANDIWGLISASRALEKDQAFDKAYCGSWVAYRLKA
ncbi:MAG TPA: hypothetical protein VFM34_10075, partial [Moraxellaceae bacterium]|nr:hypothetical protein [Moraxellaceae bacterium]